MSENKLLIEFNKVREFREFQRELSQFINLKQVLEKINEQKLIMHLNNTRIIFLKYKKTNTIATGSIEKWNIIGKKSGVIGELEVKLIEPPFFILTDIWKSLRPDQVKVILELSDEFKRDKKIRSFVESELRKALNCLRIEKCEERIDHNILLFVKKWAIPLETIRISISNSSEKFYNILSKFSNIYENKYPIRGIEDILNQIEPWQPDFLYSIQSLQD